MFHMLNRLLEWFKSLFWKEEMELTLVGLQHAGKTTFVNVIASGGFNEDMIPTVGFNMRKISKGNVTIKLWDIGGQPRFRYFYTRIIVYVARWLSTIFFLIIDKRSFTVGSILCACWPLKRLIYHIVHEKLSYMVKSFLEVG